MYTWTQTVYTHAVQGSKTKNVHGGRKNEGLLSKMHFNLRNLQLKTIMYI